jgi:DNA primase
MVNELLVNLVNKNLGNGKRTSKGNLAYHCKFCNHHKPKLEINLTDSPNGENKWNCWVCGKKGKTIKSLFKQLNILSENYIELNKLIKITGPYQEQLTKYKTISLPSEYKKIYDYPKKQIINYLLDRGLSKLDILRYDIGYCEQGLYKDMIIIPSYDATGKLNFFTARSIQKDAYIKYRNPDVSKDVIPFEMFINWDLPVILCEGMFDSIAIKRNSIPLLGKNISPSLMKKLVTNQVKTIYIALDKDAIKKSLEFCENFINEGKNVYLVELDGKDPSEIGFNEMSSLIKSSKPLTSKSLFEKKLELI